MIYTNGEWAELIEKVEASHEFLVVVLNKIHLELSAGEINLPRSHLDILNSFFPEMSRDAKVESLKDISSRFLWDFLETLILSPLEDLPKLLDELDKGSPVAIVAAWRLGCGK